MSFVFVLRFTFRNVIVAVQIVHNINKLEIWHEACLQDRPNGMNYQNDIAKKICVWGVGKNKGVAVRICNLQHYGRVVRAVSYCCMLFMVTAQLWLRHRYV